MEAAIVRFYFDTQTVPLGSPTPAGRCQTWMKVKFFGEEALPRRLTSEYKVQGFRNPWSSRTHLCQAQGAEAALVSRANPEPEPSLETTHPCLLKPGPPLTLPVTLYTHTLPLCCPHSRPLTQKNACAYTYLHTHSCQDYQGDDEGSDDGFPPPIPPS